MTVLAEDSAGTTGVFDENADATNALDIEIPASTLAAFKTSVLAAYNNDLGGVIDWETGVTAAASGGPSPNNYLTSVAATYGAGGGNTLVLNFDHTMALFTNDINGQVQVLSRQGAWHNALVPDGGNDPVGLEYSVAFSGADVVELGMAIPSRSTYGVSGVDFRATAAHSGGGSEVVDFTVGGTPGTGDTFLHFTAPAGQSITAVSVAYLDDNGQNLANGQRRPILDDLGFIVAASSSNTFADWITGKPGVNGQTGVNQDPDGDGIDSGVENFFGTEPGVFSQGLVAGTVSGNTFTFTHPLNSNPADDLTATYRWSTDLETFHDDGDPNGAGTTTVTFSDPTPAGGELFSVTATITGSVIPDKLFVDVKVTQL